LDYRDRAHFLHPMMIELNDRSFWIENLKNLLFIVIRILRHFLAVELFPRIGFARRITDDAGEIADQKNHLVAKVLKLVHLLDQHGMSKMKIGSRGVESGVDPKRPTLFEFGFEVF